MTRRVIILSNDIVPGMGMPVAAPGLRAFGLATGLESAGFEVTTVVVSGPVDTQWNAEMPPPSQPGVVILPASALDDFVASRAPCSVILINSNQADRVDRHPGVRYVLDFFAPKMLELAAGSDSDYPTSELAALRDRKLRAIDLADAFIVNGRKKTPYFLAWLLQTDRDIRKIDIRVVEMCVPSAFDEAERGETVDLVVAGYLQGWSMPGEWLRIVADHVDGETARLHLLTPSHWGKTETRVSEEVRRLKGRTGVVNHDTMLYDDFQHLMSGMDVAVDLFEYNLEREYAMVTRSIVALSCGVPIIHPPFTEVAPMVIEYDAGWIVEPDDYRSVEAAVREAIEDTHARAVKAAGARRLWSERLDPAVAVAPLVDLIETLGGEG